MMNHGWLYLLSWKEPYANNELETGRDDDSAATRHVGLGCESIPVCVV